METASILTKPALCPLKHKPFRGSYAPCSWPAVLSPNSIFGKINWIMCPTRCHSKSSMHLGGLGTLSWILHWIADGRLDLVNYYFQPVLKKDVSSAPYQSANHEGKALISARRWFLEILLWLGRRSWLPTSTRGTHSYSATQGMASFLPGTPFYSLEPNLAFP